MADTRVYFVISVGTLNPNEGQWVSLTQQAKTKPLSAAILSAARASQNFIQASKRSLGTGNVLKNTLCGFEIEDSQVAGVTAVLNAQATIRGVTGTLKNKFTLVLQGELRDSATDLGYSGAQAAQLIVTLVNNGGFDRTTAIAAVQQYLVDNTLIWHAPAS